MEAFGFVLLLQNVRRAYFSWIVVSVPSPTPTIELQLACVASVPRPEPAVQGPHLLEEGVGLPVPM